MSQSDKGGGGLPFPFCYTYVRRYVLNICVLHTSFLKFGGM